MKRAIVGAGMSAGPSEPPGRKNHEIFFGLRNLSSEQTQAVVGAEAWREGAGRHTGIRRSSR